MSVLPVGIGSEEAAGGYQIERSLRFNSADSAYLNRTPASAGTSNRIFTVSLWTKLAVDGTQRSLFGANNGAGTADAFTVTSSGAFQYEINGGTSATLITTALHRDPSAWYHIVLAVDTNQATAADRVKFYVNGVQLTSFSTNTQPAQNYNFVSWNQNKEHTIGALRVGVQYFSGYQTEFYNIDGQALTPSSFGETDTDTGVWKPKAYSGSYGTNGFYLKFADNSGTTSTTLGKDSSGNGNNWTPNNFSVTAGAGNDSLVDSPTRYGEDTGAGGEVRGNYATLNPLDRTDSNTSVTNGNLTAQGYLFGGSDYRSVKGTMYQTEKFYFEATISNTGSSADWFGQVGVANASFTCPLGTRVGGNANSWAFIIRGGSSDVAKLHNNSATQLAASLPSAGDVIMVACDPANGKVWFGRNGSWYASGDPAAGTNAAYTNVSSSVTPAAGMYYDRDVWNLNFGQRPFAYTAPSGFLSICTTNLP